MLTGEGAAFERDGAECQSVFTERVELPFLSDIQENDISCLHRIDPVINFPNRVTLQNEAYFAGGIQCAFGPGDIMVVFMDVKDEKFALVYENQIHHLFCHYITPVLGLQEIEMDKWEKYTE